MFASVSSAGWRGWKLFRSVPPKTGGPESLERSQEDCATLTSLMFRSSADFDLLCVCSRQGVHIGGRFNADGLPFCSVLFRTSRAVLGGEEERTGR